VPAPEPANGTDPAPGCQRAAPLVPPDPAGDDAPGDPESVARTICLRLLTHRARTRAELATALARRGVPPEAANRVLDRFCEVGLVDDMQVASSYAATQHRERLLSSRAVAEKLRRRGVDDETARAAIAHIDRDSEREAARRLAQRTLRTLAGTPPEVRSRRLLGALARRGYSPQLCLEVARELSTPDDRPVGTFGDGQ
jgi:regulatory protein